MWNVKPTDRWEWDVLSEEVKNIEHAIHYCSHRCLPASTSQILGNNECFEPYTTNIYSRRVLSGEFIVVNKHLLSDLIRFNLWNNDMKNKIIAANGSVQSINEIPEINDFIKPFGKSNSVR